MSKIKFYLGMAVAALSATGLPSNAHAAAANGTSHSVAHAHHGESKWHKNMSNAYVALKYYGNFFNNFGDIKNITTTSSPNNNKLMSLTSKEELHSGENDYAPGWLGFAASAGYTVDNMRAELELGYAHTGIDDKDYPNSDLAEQVEIYRGNSMLNMVTSVDPKDANMKNTGLLKVTAPTAGMNLSDFVTAKNMSGCADITVTAAAHKGRDNNALCPANYNFTIANSKTFTSGPGNEAVIKAQRVGVIKLKNEGFTEMSASLKAFYDFKMSPEAMIVPYVGAGVGVAYDELFGINKWAFKFSGHVGAKYNVTSKIGIFAGYHYDGQLNDKFDEADLPDEAKMASMKITDGFYMDDNGISAAKLPTKDDIAALNTTTGSAASDITTAITGGNMLKEKDTTVAGDDKITFEKRYGVHGLEAGLVINF